MSPPQQAQWQPTEFIDAAIRRAYASPERGAVKRCAGQINRPYWWVKRRAIRLGLTELRRKEPPWSEAELELLEKHHWKTPETLQRIFRKHGFQRSPTALKVRRKREGLRVADAEVYTARALAALMGVDISTVCGWIAKGWLRATRKGTHRIEVQGGDMHQISPRAVRDFIVNHTAHFDHRKADKYWLVDLLTGRAGAKEVAA